MSDNLHTIVLTQHIKTEFDKTTTRGLSLLSVISVRAAAGAAGMAARNTMNAKTELIHNAR